MSFTTTTKVTYPDGTVQETTTTSTKSQVGLPPSLPLSLS